MEKRRKANFIFYIQTALTLLLLVFLSNLFIDWRGLTNFIISVCGFAFLFLNIPVSIVGRILKSVGRIDRQYYLPMKILSAVNIGVAVICWGTVALILLLMLNK